MGFFFRTLRMVDHGIKPAYVFDGKPPELKGGVVRRPESTPGDSARRADAAALSWRNGSQRGTQRARRKKRPRRRVGASASPHCARG